MECGMCGFECDGSLRHNSLPLCVGCFEKVKEAEDKNGRPYICVRCGRVVRQINGKGLCADCSDEKPLSDLLMPPCPPTKIGSVLDEASRTINGERQDQYGKPEDCFALIANYWTTYLGSRGFLQEGQIGLHKEDVAMLMVLFKIAREAHSHKRDNIVDLCGYAGIYSDMVSKP